MPSQHGLTIIYVGDGKGKTTAAVGLAVRAAGAGLRVCYIQFAKGEWDSSENEILKKTNNIDVQIFGKGFVGILGDDKPIEEHRQEAERSYKFALDVIKREDGYDLVVLDELITLVEEDVLPLEKVVELIQAKPKNLHICLTGHNRYNEIIELSDLVSEMKMVKHPYYQGILAQKGIDY